MRIYMGPEFKGCQCFSGFLHSAKFQAGKKQLELRGQRSQLREPT